MSETEDTVSSAPNSERLKVIRIKRKRTDEPLDSIVVELPKKRPNIISGFNALSTDDKPQSDDNIQARKVFRFVSTVAPTEGYAPSKLKNKIEEIREKRKSKIATPVKDSEKIIEHQREQQQQQIREARRKQIKLRRDIKARSNDKPDGFSDFFHLVDLVQVEETSPQKKYASKKTKVSGEEQEDDVLMCNYLPMVREYLDQQQKEKLTEPDDYVYDVYYQDDAPPSDPSELPTTVVRLESFDEELTPENEYDGFESDTDSDDEENRVTDIYPEEDSDAYKDSDQSGEEGVTSGEEEYDFECYDDDDDGDYAYKRYYH
jgi:hypothetical protein